MLFAREVMGKHVAKKCRRRVLSRRVVQECCREVFEKSVAKDCCADVLSHVLYRSVGEEDCRGLVVQTCWRRECRAWWRREW